MKEKNWIKTEQVIENLKNEPDVEHQYCHHICGILRSTHWLEYSSERKEIGESTDWYEYYWFTVDEFLDIHKDEWWMREV